MCNNHDSYVIGEIDDGKEWNEEAQKRFIEEVERPIFDKLKKELGDEYHLIFDED